jgi:two-component system response regulator DevR
MHPNPSTHPPLKIFLVEDSVLIRQRLTALIGSIDGVEMVGEAEDADTALRGIAARSPDIVVMDLHLARSTGMEVLAALTHSGRRVVSIVLTNDSTASAREACRSAGANHFFDKTRDFKLALNLIEKMARERLAGPTGDPGEHHV